VCEFNLLGFSGMGEIARSESSRWFLLPLSLRSVIPDDGSGMSTAAGAVFRRAATYYGGRGSMCVSVLVMSG
jgi:hypothetical protein